jgi:hypothetical protein
MKKWNKLNSPIRDAMIKHLEMDAAKWGTISEKQHAALERQALNVIKCTRAPTELAMTEFGPSSEEKRKKDLLQAVTNTFHANKDLAREEAIIDEGAKETEREHAARMRDAPFAKSGRERVTTCRKNAPKGGKATAHYTDEEITNAFATFKQRNPGKIEWDAATALIRKGQPLDKYKKVTGPWNRIGRIAKDGLGITRNEWYQAL